MPVTFLKAGFVSVISVTENRESCGLCSPAGPHLHSYRQAGQLHPTGAWQSPLCRNALQALTSLSTHPFSLKVYFYQVPVAGVIQHIQNQKAYLTATQDNLALKLEGGYLKYPSLGATAEPKTVIAACPNLQFEAETPPTTSLPPYFRISLLIPLLLHKHELTELKLSSPYHIFHAKLQMTRYYVEKLIVFTLNSCKSIRLFRNNP